MSPTFTMIFSAVLNSSLLLFLFFRTHSAEVRICLLEIKEPLQRSKLVPSGFEPIGFDGEYSLRKGFKSCKMRPTHVKRPTNSERKVFILNTFLAILGYLMRLWFFNPSLTANQVFKGSPQFVEHKNLPRILIMLHYISMKNSIVGCCVLKRVHLIEPAWTKNTFFVSSSCGSIWCAA